MKKLITVVVAVAVILVGGSAFYLKVLEHPDKKLTIDSTASHSSTTVNAAADDSTSDGMWKATKDSIVGYRVKETLFGSSATATGRTSQVTGSIAITGTSVKSGSFSVDMNSVSSDRTQRDGQFRGRIMNTAQFPTATFKLTQPITLMSVALNQEIKATATGDLTLHGVTQSVTFDVVAKRVTGQIKVNGEIPIHFADYGINNPSGGPARVGDAGTLEFTLVFTR
ncbi:MAG TPA: YceI family protein [Acidimicrobiales bacterium]|nr:YceI family protein [Acidimicrobiales bacterium]